MTAAFIALNNSTDIRYRPVNLRIKILVARCTTQSKQNGQGFCCLWKVNGICGYVVLVLLLKRCYDNADPNVTFIYERVYG